MFLLGVGPVPEETRGRPPSTTRPTLCVRRIIFDFYPISIQFCASDFLSMQFCFLHTFCTRQGDLERFLFCCCFQFQSVYICPQGANQPLLWARAGLPRPGSRPRLGSSSQPCSHSWALARQVRANQCPLMSSQAGGFAQRAPLRGRPVWRGCRRSCHSQSATS